MPGFAFHSWHFSQRVDREQQVGLCVRGKPGWVRFVQQWQSQVAPLLFLNREGQGMVKTLSCTCRVVTLIALVPLTLLH